MFCNKCGAQLLEGARFCRVCGQPTSDASPSSEIHEAPTSEFPAATAPPAYTPVADQQPVSEPPTSGKALASLISGIAGFLVLPFFASIAAVVLGHLSLSEIKKSAGRLKGGGMAIAGLVMGYIGIAFIPIILIIAAIAIPNLLRSRIAANETAAVGSVRRINTAQVLHNAKSPEKGFTCDLDGLRAVSTGEANAVDSGLASGTKSGYHFTLRDCESEISDGPVTRYNVIAEPTTSGASGQRTFCSDESGVIRFVSTSSAEACLTDGVPLE